MRKTLINIFIIVFVFSAILETSARFLRTPTLYIPDKIMGWKTKKNFSHSYINYTQNNKKYFAKVDTNQDGYLEFISNKDESKNLIILGDSHVLGSTISNEEHWISVIHENLKRNKININIFGLGAGGYSTYQELLLLKKAKEKINIDFLILVFSVNDLINNNFYLEKENPHFMQYSFRPYINEKKEKIYNNTFLSKMLRSKLVANSYFLNYIFHKIATINNNIKSKKEKFNSLIKLNEIKSAEISNHILIQIQKELHKTPLYIFFPEYIDKDVKKMIIKNTRYEEINLNNLRDDKKKINIQDFYHQDLGHFAPEGSRIIGTLVYEKLKEKLIILENNYYTN